MLPEDTPNRTPEPARAPDAPEETPRGVAWVALAAAALAVAAVWHRIVFLDETLVFRDTLQFTLPSRQAVATAIRAGRLPEWWDLVGTGVALAANPIYAALSPIAWVLLPIPRVGHDAYTLFHLLMAGAGAGLWAARLGADRRGVALAAALYAASGYVVSTVPNGMAPVVAWMPWVAWAADRLGAAADGGARLRAALLLAFAWALQLLPGEPGQVIATGWLMVAVLLGRSGVRGWRILGWATASVAGAMLLDAAMLLPAIHQLRLSPRGVGLELQAGAFWSLHPVRLLEIVWPNVLGSPVSPATALQALVKKGGPGLESMGPVWSLSVHVGAVPIVLALLARRGRMRAALLAASIGFLLLALGTYTPVYAAYRAVFLPERVMRFPEKHVVGAIAVWCALAGAGLTQMLRAPPRRIVPRGLAAGGAVAAALALCVLAFGPRLLVRIVGSSSGFDVARIARLEASGGAVLALSLIFLASAVALAARGRLRSAAAVAAIAALAPLAWTSTFVIRTASRDRVLARPPVLDLILEAEPEARLARSAFRVYRGWEPTGVAGNDGEMLAAYEMETIAANTASRFGLCAMPGLDSGATTKTERLLLALNAMDGWTPMKLLGTRWGLVWMPPGAVLSRPPAMVLAKGWHVVHVPEARPRAFVAPRWYTAKEGPAAIADFARVERAEDLGRVAVDGVPPSGPERESVALSPCFIETRVPEEVQVLCSSPLGGWAVLLDEHVPGWTAELDGAPAEIRLVEGFFRGVRVGPGSHEIVFRYRTPGLRIGIAVSLAAWAALIGWAVALSARRRRSGSAVASP